MYVTADIKIELTDVCFREKSIPVSTITTNTAKRLYQENTMPGALSVLYTWWDIATEA